jgi:hypothetical protein
MSDSNPFFYPDITSGAIENDDPANVYVNSFIVLNYLLTPKSIIFKTASLSIVSAVINLDSS